eukprot:TRINITY_DN10976_c0_g1_i1.p1 TRINITY_DN10976_c0_g1~~TRINITY_DN10976_c0_g1_i1.p1  ORF type:complete len:444 (+),score=30.31 TRINITY_DN10976_c0_g1_i1:34-1365(+)
MVHVQRILARVLAAGHGSTCNVVDAVTLLQVTSPSDILAVALAADELRRRAPCGDRVTYVINRNINFTNACVKRCGFCAFSRTGRDAEAYYLPDEEVVRRAAEAVELGATEVCVQAGLPLRDATGQPFTGEKYLQLFAAIKDRFPNLHLHALSPEEVLYGARTMKLSVEDFLVKAKAAGVGSLPGTSAEILDDDVRARIAPGRLSTQQWITVIKAAHRVGLRTSSTIMYGHLETPEHIARHLEVLRTIQEETGGFTEFVPLSFVASEAPMYRNIRQRKSLGLRGGPTGREVLLMHAVARIMLSGMIDNIQVSWPKEGLRLAQLLLGGGANDLGGVLMNESISTAAGAPHGQLATPSELRQVILDIGRVPVQRTTIYGTVREFDRTPEVTDEAMEDPLDRLARGEGPNLGSYRELTQDSRWRVTPVWRNRQKDSAPKATGEDQL